MNNTTRPHDSSAQHPHDPFHGAALVLADGREVPITEEMVQTALTTLAHEEDPVITNQPGTQKD